MATSVIWDMKDKQVAAVNFEFSKEVNTYLMASGEMLKATMTVLDSSGKRIGKVWNSGMGGLLVLKWSQKSEFPTPGVIVGSRVYKYSGDGEYLGEVDSQNILSASRHILGDVSVQWSNDDEDFITWNVEQDLENNPDLNASQLKVRITQGAYKRIREIAGCSALALGCFDR